MSYYVRIATRGSAKTGSPRQALNYITDAHDIRRDTSYSDAELHYIARMDSGWKTDLEGGRVPLVGFGELAGELDEKAMAARFEESCLPYHSIRGTTGYKSITLTVPKEVSLYAEGHREEAKVAINAAIEQALDRAFGGFSYSAVAAIHTRNQAGEIHYHAHVLVGKFARAIETGRMVSLNSSTTGKNTPSRLREMKAGWQEGIEKEFRERLQLGIEQKTSRSPVALVLPDGTRLEPLNRESRRVLEKELCPTFTETSDDGHALMRHFRWSAMDDRIFEIASGARGTSAWDVPAFKEAFPDQARFVARYEARVVTLQSIGYLSPGGTINSAFRVHFAAHHGVLTPELQRVRIDLMHRLGKETNDKNARGNSAGPLHPDQFWTQIQKYADLRHRIERLGYSKDDVANIFARAQAKKPTRETLQRIRAAAETRAAKVPPSTLPQTKTILRAYVDLQKSKVHRIYLVTTGMIQFWRLGEKLALARYIKKVAERDLFFAKEKRIAQVGRALRPVIWLVRVAMPGEARRLDQAVTRCARLAYQQQLRRAGREAIQKAYDQWRQEYIQKPIDRLKQESSALERPAQQAEHSRLDAVQAKISLPDNKAAIAVFLRGYQALTSIPGETKTIASISTWLGKEDELVAQVLHHSKGNPTNLTKEQYDAAVRIGRVGNLLTAADGAPGIKMPSALAPQRADIDRLSSRLRSFGLRHPLTTSNLAAFSPSNMRAHLADARKAGLLDDGPTWTFKYSAARNFVQDLVRQLDHNRLPSDR
jgi:hypothetical protein